MKTTLRILLLAAALPLLCACGDKGPLVMPDKSKPASPARTAPTAPPASPGTSTLPAPPASPAG
ncbi:MAG TPA: sugar transporter [Xanthomonadaceae bacterium]|jgi:predicted small lipoprotein YifL|nr:sugar transporter [Xanthomonadaceae bacterium]